MPKTQKQIPMRKVCIVIQSLVSRRPNNHLGYSKDREKHHALPTMKRRKNVVYDVTNVEMHELFELDESGPLPNVIPKRANSLAVVEGVLSRFFKPTAATSTIGHVCQARFVVHSEQDARWARARSSRPIAVRADLLCRPAVPLAGRLRSGTHH